MNHNVEIHVNSNDDTRLLGQFLSTRPQILNIDNSVRVPIVFGGDEAIRLEYRGEVGLEEFRNYVTKMVSAHKHVFVLNADDLECIKNTPACIGQILKTAGPNKTISMFFDEEPHANIISYLVSKKKVIRWQRLPAEIPAGDDTPLNYDEKFSDFSMRFESRAREDALEIIKGVIDVISEDLSKPGLRVLNSVSEARTNKLEDMLVKLALEQGAGYKARREHARKFFLSLVLRETCPKFTITSGDDPVDFFNTHLRTKLKYFDLPRTCLNLASPNLSYILKKQSRFEETK